MMICWEEEFKTLQPPAGAGGEPPFVTVWNLPANLQYFDGHFPQNPVFPAVGILDASVYFLRAALGRADLTLHSVINAKFLSPIAAGQTVRIELIRISDQEWQAEWKEESNAKLLATLRLQFRFAE